MDRKSWGGRLLTIVACFIVLMLCGPTVAKSWTDYDRLHAVEKFLDAVYPELQQHGGFLTMQTEEFNSNSDQLYLFFVQCWPGSGVPGGGEKAPPHCNGYIGSVVSDFLDLIVWTGPAKFPIRHFDARGKFVDEKQNRFLAEMKAHPEWKEPEKLEALRKAGPKFGPENKEAFLKSVPAEIVYQFSSCRLNLGTATFGPDYGWVIQGTHRQFKRDLPCHANFEPLDGKLIGIDEV
jgi:hypothetical protein